MLFKKKSSGKEKKVDWIELTTLGQLKEIIEASNEKPQLLFKHSTRCPISSTALSRFEREWDLTPEQCEAYYLDLITYRPVSNQIAEDLGVVHQSPQAILVINGKAVYNSSHNLIEAKKVKEIVEG